MNNVINVGVLGLGTVGSGVVHILKEHYKKIALNTGYEVKVKTVVVRDLEKERDVCIDGIAVTSHADEVLNDSNIDIVVEVMEELKKQNSILLRLYEIKTCRNSK